MSSLGGDTLKYLKAAMAIGQAHYPDRTFKIFICNAPGWFSMLWKMVKPMINEATQKKISILSKSETLKGLSEVLTLDNIPAYYGGKLDCGISGQPDVCRTQSPDALRLQRYVEKINAGRHRELEADVDAETSAAAAAAGESLPPNMRCGQTEDEQVLFSFFPLFTLFPSVFLLFFCLLLFFYTKPDQPVWAHELAQ